jgi:hypothetical protein
MMNANTFRCVVCLNWIVGNDPQEYLWKVVEFPCVPSVGMNLVFECGIDVVDVDVTHLEWWENRPGWIEVHTEMFTFNGDAEVFAGAMRDKGWRWEWRECMVDMIDQVAGEQ